MAHFTTTVDGIIIHNRETGEATFWPQATDAEGAQGFCRFAPIFHAPQFQIAVFLNTYYQDSDCFSVCYLLKILLQFLYALFIWSFAYLLINDQGGIKIGNTILSICLFQKDAVVCALTYIKYYTLPLSGKVHSSTSKLLRSPNSASEKKIHNNKKNFWLSFYLYLVCNLSGHCWVSLFRTTHVTAISGDGVILNESWKSHFFQYFKEDNRLWKPQDYWDLWLCRLDTNCTDIVTFHALASIIPSQQEVLSLNERKA